MPGHAVEPLQRAQFAVRRASKSPRKSGLEAGCMRDECRGRSHTMAPWERISTIDRLPLSCSSLHLLIAISLVIFYLPAQASAVPIASPQNVSQLRSRSSEARVKRDDLSYGFDGYSAVIAFGASYTDNAHPRAAKYAGSMRNFYPYSLDSGRYTNGRVAVEYMVDATSTPALRGFQGENVRLIDYAYGGSVIKNGVDDTDGSALAPGAVSQIAMYLSDLSKNIIDPGNGRVVHYFNSGINPVVQIWSNTLRGGLNAASRAGAARAIDTNIELFTNAIQSIVSSPVVASQLAAADYFIVGIPPLETVPAFTATIPGNRDRTTALAFLQALSQQYNDGLEAFASSLQMTTPETTRVFWFDLATLWRDMYASPSSFNFAVNPITKTCYSGGKVCSNPSKFLYFDPLHPVTTVHQMMAQRFNTLLNAL